MCYVCVLEELCSSEYVACVYEVSVCYVYYTTMKKRRYTGALYNTSILQL